MAFSELFLSALRDLHTHPSSQPQHQTPSKQLPILFENAPDENTQPTNCERWSIHPSLHPNVSRLLEEEGLYFDFHPLDSTLDCIRQYDTNIMGRFTCSNKSCPRTGWSSKRIAVTIRVYGDFEYNVRVYHQRCRSCKGLSEPVLNNSYAERVAYRIKKWSGVECEVPVFEGEDNRRPHDRELCEGCRDGRCGDLGRGDGGPLEEDLMDFV